jgi:hypothetical protein
LALFLPDKYKIAAFWIIAIKAFDLTIELKINTNKLSSLIFGNR